MSPLFDDFIKSGRFLKNWSPKTERSYGQAFASFSRFQESLRRDTARTTESNGIPALPTWEPLAVSSALTKAHLEAWVLHMRQNGMAPGGCNSYIRAMNSFLTWLHEEGHVPTHLRLKTLSNPPAVFETFTEAEVTAIVTHKPRSRSAIRAWTLVMCLVDTGIRIDEALGLEIAKVDFESLNLRVLGKGSRERIVPFSLELRKVLYRFTRGQEGRFVFRTSSGTRMTYRNAYRDIKAVFDAVGIKGDRVHPHALRHLFAVNYIRRGGDLYRLSRILGHQSVSTTQLYLRSMPPEQVAEGHCSPLTRVRAS